MRRTSVERRAAGGGEAAGVGAPGVAAPGGPPGRWVAIGCVVAVATAAAIWPALATPGGIPGQAAMPVDGAHGVFVFAAVADRVRGAADAWALQEIWHPVGRPLLLSVQNAVDAVLAAPLLWALGPARGLAAFTAVVLATNTLAGAWLGRVAGGTAAAALGGAVALGFSPYAWGEVDFGRTTQAWLAPMALAVGLAWRAAEAPERRGARVLAGAALALAGYHYWFYGLFGAVAVAGATLGRAGVRRGLPVLGEIAAVAIALVAPFAAYVALAWADVPGTSEAVGRFSTGASFLGGIPGGPGPARSDLYVPQLLVLLALLALAGRPRAAAAGVLVAAFALGVFALGESVRAGDTTVWLPYAWLRRLPGLRRFWWPNRALGAVTVALVAALALTLGRLRGPWLAGGVGAVLLSAAQVARSPGAPGAWTIPAVGAWHAALPPGAVLVLPMTSPDAGKRALAQQPLHGRPLVNGMSMWEDSLVPADWRAWAEGQPVVDALWRAERGEPARIDAAGVARLAEDGVVGIVVDRSAVGRGAPGDAATTGAADLARLLDPVLGPARCPPGEAWCWWPLPTAGSAP